MNPHDFQYITYWILHTICVMVDLYPDIHMNDDIHSNVYR